MHCRICSIDSQRWLFIAVFTTKVGVCNAVLTASDVSACLVASGFGPSNTAVKIIVIVLQ